MSWVHAGEGECRFELYEEMKRLYGRNHNLRCMNGKYASSTKCTGFCFCGDHPGFITNKLMQEHHCTDRDCRYFLEKPAKIRTAKARRQNERL